MHFDQLGRRHFITLVGGAAAWSIAARAEQPAKAPRVGVVSPATSETTAALTAFREEIRKLGYIEGQTIALDFRLSKGGADALPALAAELVRIPVNVIVTDTTSAALAAFGATRTIPIVMGATGGDPVALGLAKRISRPGGNVTGAQLLTGLSQTRLRLLKQGFPGAKRVAVLANPKDALSVAEMPKLEKAAKRMGVRLLRLAASTPAELRALAPSVLSASDGLLVMPGGMFWNNRAMIIDIASTARVPAIYAEREYADDGGLIAYGPDVSEHFRLAAGYVDRILRGANPGDLAIFAISRFDFVINLRTARALGLALPPSFVSAANEVIE
jgi:putative tryptophan/tyrosine transport system substrate-binding protein